MAENVFEVVKESVTTREAAEMYGIEVKRGGMACCPFHDDRHPSMKVDRRFHCFGCGADGDVIDFTARLYNLTPKEAAEKLAQDFGLAYDSQAPPRRNYVRQKSEAQKLKEKREHGWRVLTDYYHLLRKWETDYSPKTPDEDPHPRFMEAIQKKDYTGYLLDFLIDSSTEEQDKWFAEHSAEIAAIEGRVKIMAEKPTNRERLREITEGIEQGIKELFESEKYMRYLSVMSRFHRYSVNNTMLIYMQRPDATLVAGYNKWKNQFERHVKRGEHGITIIAPTPYKKKIEEQKLDPDTKAPMLDKDGKVIMEEKEIEIPLFRPVKVFDVSQTDGKPLPELASSLSGNVQNYEVFMEALRRSAPVPIEFEPMAANMDGYFSSDQQRIALRPGMSEVQTVSAAIHEIAHSKLHDPKRAEPEPAWKVVMVSDGGTRKNYSQGFATEVEAEQFAADADWRYVDENQFEWRLEVEEDHSAEIQAAKDRRTEEVQAESISYAVCQYYGIETGDNSFGYIASWSQGKELKELRASLEVINKTAGELITDIDRHYKEICKERGIDPAARREPEQKPGPIEQLAADIDQFAFDYDPYEYRDTVDDRETALRELTASLQNGDAQDVRKWLQDIAEDEPGEWTAEAAALLDRLDQLVPEKEAILADEPDPNLVKMADEAMAMGIDTAWNSGEEFPLSFSDDSTVQESSQPSAEFREALLVLDDAAYLHIQPCDTGWDYTLYDKETMRELDGGQLDAPDLRRSEAALRICEDLNMGNASIKYAPLSMIETLQETAYQQMQEQVSQQAEETAAVPTQLPDTPEQALDEYPMPDPALTQDDLEMLSTPHLDEMDENYKRLQYNRYADDFLISITGSKQDAENIKEQVKIFLKDKLNLTMSEEKTHVTHSSEKVRYLGYDIRISRSQDTKRTKKGLQRVWYGKVQLYMPKEKWIAKLHEYGAFKIKKDENGKEIWKPLHRGALMPLDDVAIISKYNSEIRGLYNYYRLAINVCNLGKFHSIMRGSCLKTLAAKYNSSVMKMYKKYRSVKGDFGADYKTKSGTKRCEFYNEGFRRNNNIAPEFVDIMPKYRGQIKPNSLAGRLKSGQCEMCGANPVKVYMHHVKRLKDLNADNEFDELMLLKRRKSLALCPKCYEEAKTKSLKL